MEGVHPVSNPICYMPSSEPYRTPFQSSWLVYTAQHKWKQQAQESSYFSVPPSVYLTSRISGWNLMKSTEQYVYYTTGCHHTHLFIDFLK